MAKKVLVLFAVAGLLAFAFAGQRAGSAGTSSPARHRLDRDSILKLHARPHRAVLPPGDLNRVMRQARTNPKPALPPRFDTGPFTEDEFMVAPDDPAVSQDYPSVAFDGSKYLVVWEDMDASYNTTIWGILIEASGTPSDDSGFLISDYTGMASPSQPAVAFNGTEYLVVWRDYTPDGNIYGARVSTAGAVTDLADPICDATSDQYSPAVASDGSRFLVVWIDERDGQYDIYGARVSSTGTILDPDGIVIREDPDGATYAPAVAFGDQVYLVVWENYDVDYNATIRGARVQPNGTLLDTNGILISIDPPEDQQFSPAVAFGGTDFLVVWDDRDDNYSSDIIGARVNEAGAVRDTVSFGICTEASDQYYASVAFNGTDYIVVWEDTRNSNYYDIYGCEVDLAREVGTAYQVTARTYSGQPALASGPVEGQEMVAYESYTEDPYYADRIWTRRATLTMNGDADVVAVSIQRPVASFLTEGSWLIPPKAWFRNDGAEPRSFNAEFTITNEDGDTILSSTRTVLGLRPGDTYKRGVMFDSFDIETEGTGLYTARCTTLLADDDDKSNDSMSAIFQGCNFINFSDIDDGDLTPTPDTCWARGIPASPPWTERPPMDDSAWGERLNGQQGNNENSYLTSPKYEAFQDDPSIAFQHCFSTESLADGGNLEYKYGAGSWSVATPSAGFPYNGNVAALGGAGWSGWLSGHSGWKQSVFTFGSVADGDSFRVRFHYASGASTNSRGWLIDELAGIGCDLYVGKMGSAGFIDTMKVWPNPACGKAQVSYTLRKAGNVAVKLYDASGRLTARVPTGGSRQGPNTTTLDATRLARGVYFVKVEGASNFKTTKVIIE